MQQEQKRGGEKLVFPPFLVAINFTKLKIFHLLKVVGNEKEGGSGKWQMIDIGLGLW